MPLTLSDEEIKILNRFFGYASTVEDVALRPDEEQVWAKVMMANDKIDQAKQVVETTHTGVVPPDPPASKFEEEYAPAAE